MSGSRKRGETIRKFILDSVFRHPRDIVAVTAKEFGISPQAVNKHVKQLLAREALDVTGATRNRRYALRTTLAKTIKYRLSNLKEDVVWTKDIAPLVSNLPKNVRDIWQYGLTEMLNNAIDHSSGTIVHVSVYKTATGHEMFVIDDGEGIFAKIQRALHLDDERHAVLELSKGKLTTDPEHHSGQGIFFSSKMFDYFVIISGRTTFRHYSATDLDWIDEDTDPELGTMVLMRLRNDTTRSAKEVFDAFASDDDDYGFTKTVVPVRLAQYGDYALVSRSQAKRLLAGLDRFKTVVLDFDKVDSIGQAFADEVFRVFTNQHPNIALVEKNPNPEVQRMIIRARKHDQGG